MALPTNTSAPGGQLDFGVDFGIGEKQKLDLSKPREGLSHFCLHNPVLNQFALSGPEEMCATVLFAVASQLKDWGTIYTLYPYLVQYLKDGHRVDRYDPKDVKQIGVLLFPHNKSIQKMWDMRNEMFSTIKSLYHDDLALFKYLRSLPGLGVVKAGFAIQLIAGKFGCIDSINSYFYGSTAPNVQGNSDKKQAEYVAYLNQLEKTLQDPISKRLWDDWCDIVAHKIRNSGGKSQKDLAVTLHNGTQSIRSYAPSIITKDYYKNGANKTGHDVSFEHGEAITGAFSGADDFKIHRLEESLRQAIAGSLLLLEGNVVPVFEGEGTGSTFSIKSDGIGYLVSMLVAGQVVGELNLLPVIKYAEYLHTQLSELDDEEHTFDQDVKAVDGYYAVAMVESHQPKTPGIGSALVRHALENINAKGLVLALVDVADEKIVSIFKKFGANISPGHEFLVLDKNQQLNEDCACEHQAEPDETDGWGEKEWADSWAQQRAAHEANPETLLESVIQPIHGLILENRDSPDLPVHSSDELRQLVGYPERVKRHEHESKVRGWEFGQQMGLEPTPKPKYEPPTEPVTALKTAGIDDYLSPGSTAYNGGVPAKRTDELSNWMRRALPIAKTWRSSVQGAHYDDIYSAASVTLGPAMPGERMSLFSVSCHVSPRDGYSIDVVAFLGAPGDLGEHIPGYKVPDYRFHRLTKEQAEQRLAGIPATFAEYRALNIKNFGFDPFTGQGQAPDVDISDLHNLHESTLHSAIRASRLLLESVTSPEPITEGINPGSSLEEFARNSKVENGLGGRHSLYFTKPDGNRVLVAQRRDAPADEAAWKAEVFGKFQAPQGNEVLTEGVNGTMTAQEAFVLARKKGIHLGADSDYFQLSPSQQEFLLELAAATGYTKSSNSPRSTARAFYKHLCLGTRYPVWLKHDYKSFRPMSPEEAKNHEFTITSSGISTQANMQAPDGYMAHYLTGGHLGHMKIEA